MIELINICVQSGISHWGYNWYNRFPDCKFRTACGLQTKPELLIQGSLTEISCEKCLAELRVRHHYEVSLPILLERIDLLAAADFLEGDNVQGYYFEHAAKALRSLAKQMDPQQFLTKLK